MNLTKKLASLLAAVVVSLAGVGRAEDAAAPAGKTDYLRYCAPCHGEHGKGDGPVAPALRVAPSDLTSLSKHGLTKSDILAAIDGRRQLAAHGSREMPVWGAIFEGELRDQGTKYPGYLSLLKSAALVDYVIDIQAPE